MLFPFCERTTNIEIKHKTRQDFKHKETETDGNRKSSKSMNADIEGPTTSGWGWMQARSKSILLHQHRCRSLFVNERQTSKSNTKRVRISNTKRQRQWKSKIIKINQC